ncbi:plasmid mobilization protein, partial [Salmonella enterica]|nr:plasmid mobilization protein [Salmonella enterica]
MHLAAWLCSRVKFICRDRGGLPGGLLLFLADCRPVRGEAVRG